MKPTRRVFLAAALLTVLCVPAVAHGDDRSLEGTYRAGALKTERPVAQLERVSKAFDRVRTKRGFRRVGRIALRVIGRYRRAITEWRNDVALAVPSSPTGTEAKAKCLGSLDALRAAGRALKRAITYTLRAVRGDSKRNFRRADRQLALQARLIGRAEALEREAEQLFSKARAERGE